MLRNMSIYDVGETINTRKPGPEVSGQIRFRDFCRPRGASTPRSSKVQVRIYIPKEYEFYVMTA